MDFTDAALPVVRLRMRPLLAVHPHAPADRWRAAMQEAGMLTEIGETNGNEDPREWIKLAQAQIEELSALDLKRFCKGGPPEGVQWRDAPWWAWLLVVVEPVVAANLGLFEGDTAQEHLIHALLVYVLPAIGVLGLLAYGWSRFYRRRADRLQGLEELTHERMAVLRRLKQTAVRITQRTFVARVGNRVLLSTADLDWLRTQARKARAAGHPELARQLDMEGDRLEDAIRSALYVPPRNWSQTGLITDRERWEQLLEGVGLAA